MWRVILAYVLKGHDIKTNVDCKTNHFVYLEKPVCHNDASHFDVYEQNRQENFTSKCCFALQITRKEYNRQNNRLRYEHRNINNSKNEIYIYNINI